MMGDMGNSGGKTVKLTLLLTCSVKYSFDFKFKLIDTFCWLQNGKSIFDHSLIYILVCAQRVCSLFCCEEQPG